MQLKRARTDRLTPQLVESPSDGGGARDRGLQVEPRNERTETYTVLKVDYGTAVELDHIVPPRLNGVRKDYIWVTVSRLFVSHYSFNSYRYGIGTPNRSNPAEVREGRISSIGEEAKSHQVQPTHNTSAVPSNSLFLDGRRR